MATQEFTCIGSTTASSSTSSISISVPSGTGGNLMLLYKMTLAGSVVTWLRFNNDSGTNYAYHGISWENSNTARGNDTQTGIAIMQPNDDDDWCASGSIYIPDSQTSNKCVSIVNDGGGTYRWFQSSGTWFNTSSRVTSVSLHPTGSSFQSGSSVSLYALGEA